MEEAKGPALWSKAEGLAPLNDNLLLGEDLAPKEAETLSAGLSAGLIAVFPDGLGMTREGLAVAPLIEVEGEAPAAVGGGDAVGGGGDAETPVEVDTSTRV